jgi:hypothetical protein
VLLEQRTTALGAAARAPLLLALFLCGCPHWFNPTRHTPCVPGVVGDASAKLELEALGLDASGAAHVLQDGDPLLFHVPGQGGYVLFAGAGARNLEGCGAAVTAQLIDPASGNPITNKDQRPVDFEVESGGFWVPADDSLTAQLANIPACPDALGQGFTGRTATLQVTVQDAGGRSATITRKVVPTCPAGDKQCACVCGPNFHPGGC